LTRGLFRIWLVGSVLWLIVAFELTGVWSVVVKWNQDLLATDDEIYARISPIGMSCAGRITASYSFDECYSDSLQRALAASGLMPYGKAADQMEHFLYLGLGVPALAFGIGLMTLWAVAGFRK
jgi:hypothetical protein